jgi:LruC domain-containing protein
MKKFYSLTQMLTIVFAFVLGVLYSNNTVAQANCEVTGVNGGGFTTTIQAVVDNCDGTYSIILRVDHDGCGGPNCQDLSHFSVEADPGTYSDVQVAVISGSLNYNLVMGPNLGQDPFQGFKLDNVSGIGGGKAGSFTISYTLEGDLQDQQVSAKAGNNGQIYAFTKADFESVMDCAGTGCNPAVCEIEKYNGGAFYTTLMSVVDDCEKITIIIKVEDRDEGQDLSHFAIEAATGAYSNVSVTPLPGTTFSYTVDLGPNLGSTQNFQGFKVDNISGLDQGEGFLVKYELTTLQAQQMAAKTGQNNFITEFTLADFNWMMECADSGCDDVVIDNRFPATGFGTLAFEDLWPGKGDYDFNDLVIDYQFDIESNTGNFVDKVKATFVIKAFGASYENGFGFQLSSAIDAADLTVFGHSLTENYITLNSNGTEAGQSKPTIIVYDNAYNEMEYPGTGIGVNTEQDAPYVEPVSINITIDFAPNTYTLTDLDIAGFNPFIIVNKDRSVEVHLPNYPPTDLVDTGKFGTWEDDSNAGSGRWYVNDKNLPWAINIYESFAYPLEKQEILWAHLKFAEWAMSGGALFPDWYKNLSGYRNNSLIYQVPAK